VEQENAGATRSVEVRDKAGRTGGAEVINLLPLLYIEERVETFAW
jgi:hypothetical protein